MPSGTLAIFRACGKFIIRPFLNVAAAFFIFTTPLPALADIPSDEALSIRTRTNEAYDPIGYRAGDINFYPSLTNALRYTDNVYATKNNEVDDFVYALRPQVDILSDFIRHEISASLYAERGIHHNISEENYTDYGAKVGGRIDWNGQTSMPIDVSYTRSHYRRGSPDDRNSITPLVFDLYEAAIGLVHKGQTIAAKTLARAKRYMYEDSRTVTVPIINADRDRDEATLDTSIGMSEDAAFAPFLYFNLKNVSYDMDLDRGGYDRDSAQYETGAGAIINFSGITRASFHAGYLRRNFSDSRFSDLDALSYGVNVSWEPSPLMMFLLQARRTVEESILLGAAASVDTSVNLTVDYELFPNLFLYPTVGYLERDYRGIDKTVTAYNAGIDSTYKMNRNFWLSLSYRYTAQEDEGRDTTGTDEYDSNNYSLSLKMQF